MGQDVEIAVRPTRKQRRVLASSSRPPSLLGFWLRSRLDLGFGLSGSPPLLLQRWLSDEAV